MHLVTCYKQSLYNFIPHEREKCLPRDFVPCGLFVKSGMEKLSLRNS